MEINATLLGQMITFGIFVWFTMKFVWPLLAQALEERKQKIADGLAAAEQGNLKLQTAGEEATSIIAKAKQDGQGIINKAHAQANQILEQAREQARQERDDIIASGHAEVKLAENKAKSKLQGKVAGLVVRAASKILSRSINEADHRGMLDGLAKEINSK